METVKVVTEPEGDPKTGRSRPKSGVSFPYFDLDSSVDVAKTMHGKAGGLCDLPQLAALLKYSGVKNGSFRMRVSAAKMFGFIEEADEKKLRVSSRGREIIAPVSVATATRAKVDAFLAVELFKKVFDQYHGTSLPESVGLKNQLQTEYGVVPDRVPPTVRILLDSAEQAGLFATAGNRSRMVMPPLIPGSGSAVTDDPANKREITDDPPADPIQEGGGSGGGGNGGGFDGGGIDPAILGLLQRLPPGGTPLNKKRRESLIAAFTATVGFIYPDPEGEE